MGYGIIQFLSHPGDFLLYYRVATRAGGEECVFLFQLFQLILKLGDGGDGRGVGHGAIAFRLALGSAFNGEHEFLLSLLVQALDLSNVMGIIFALDCDAARELKEEKGKNHKTSEANWIMSSGEASLAMAFRFGDRQGTELSWLSINDSMSL